MGLSFSVTPAPLLLLLVLSVMNEATFCLLVVHRMFLQFLLSPLGLIVLWVSILLFQLGSMSVVYGSTEALAVVLVAVRLLR